MTAALTPSLALDYLRELSADLRAAIVLDAAGNRLAGPERLAAPAAAVAHQAPLIAASTPAGRVFCARDERHAVLAATGPLALPGLTIHDLRTVLLALGGGIAEGPSVEGSAAAAEAVLRAL
jgi:hypothetical protein